MSLNNFLKQLQISENSIQIYNLLFGKLPMTFGEINALIPNSSEEECKTIIKELLNSGLLILITPHEPEILTYYQAIPLFNPILLYYENITASLGKIKETIQDLMNNSINKVFQGNEEVEINSIYDSINDVIDDINEDTIIQKQEIADLIENMEILNEFKGILFGLKKKVKGTAQTQFSDLVKTFSKTKNKIIKRVMTLELKKNEEQVIKIIEEEFKKKLDKVVAYFTTSIQEEIEAEFNEIKQPVEDLISTLFNYREEFSTILSNMVSNFDIKMKKTFELIKNKRDIFSSGLDLLENQVIANLDAIINSSIDQVAALNKPMEIVMKEYLEKILTTNRMSIKNTWSITSRTKIDEEIKNLISKSKENITIIIPKIEEYLSIDDFQDIPSNMRIRIASSDPQTNSRVKKFMEIKGVEFNNLPNENVVILKGDKRYLIIAVIFKDSKDPINNVLGIGCNSQPLMNVFNTLIEKYWTAGRIDAFKGVDKQATQPTPAKPIASNYISQIKTKKPDMPIKFEIPNTNQKPEMPKVNGAPTKPLSSELKSQLTQQKEQPQPQSQPQPQPQQQVKSPEIAPQPEQPQPPLPLKGEGFLSKTVPKPEDVDGIQINNAFNTLLQKLNTVKAKDFSIELQAIADLVLEKRGFSVTLHKLRSCINKFKDSDILLNDNEKQEIFAEMEEWKEHLL